jgi:hypothetical protein
MTKRQLADFFQVSTTTIDTLRRRRLIRWIKIGGRVRFPSPSVVDFLVRHQHHAAIA